MRRGNVRSLYSAVKIIQVLQGNTKFPAQAVSLSQVPKGIVVQMSICTINDRKRIL